MNQPSTQPDDDAGTTVDDVNRPGRSARPPTTGQSDVDCAAAQAATDADADAGPVPPGYEPL